ncbi:MAG TPA: cytochrome c biogenesis protein CcsA [Acidobacteriaceae bacterium]|nr:cytochrome c biogenesis protein CcsA [Acidobacteriaceae bacterium]
MFLLWLRVAAIFYAVASVAALPAVLYGRPGWRRICIPAAVAAFFFHFVSLIEMLTAAHRWMPAGMREVESLLALAVCAVFLLIVLVYRTVSFGIFALPLSLLLVLEPAIHLGQGSFPSPVVRGGWLFLHVSALLTAYAALFFSLVANLLYLVQERRLKKKNKIGFLTWLPPLDTMERISSSMLSIGFPFMTIGLLAGSLIAQQSVGAIYFLDPKVLLSFGMWVVYLVMIFVRRSMGLRGRRAVYLSSFAFLLVLSVWAANQFSSVHRFTTP